MKSKHFLIAGIALAALALLPETLSASTTGSASTNDFGGAEIYQKSIEIQTFLFGPATRFAAVLGLGWGVMQAVLSSAIRPLLFWGAIALTVSVSSGVLSKIFPANASSMIIPYTIESVECSERT